MTAEYTERPKSEQKCSENVQKLLSLPSPSSLLISISGTVFSLTSALHWQKSEHISPDLERRRLEEQFPEK